MTIIRSLLPATMHPPPALATLRVSSVDACPVGGNLLVAIAQGATLPRVEWLFRQLRTDLQGMQLLECGPSGEVATAVSAHRLGCAVTLCELSSEDTTAAVDQGASMSRRVVDCPMRSLNSAELLIIDGAWHCLMRFVIPPCPQSGRRIIFPTAQDDVPNTLAVFERR